MQTGCPRDFLAKKPHKEPIAEGVNAYVMQSTGLLDIKGVEIFEGDIVAWPAMQPAVVEWKYAGWYAGAKLVYVVQDNPRGLPLTVIGNIHENKELVGR
jgi:hypothetical protein